MGAVGFGSVSRKFCPSLPNITSLISRDSRVVLVVSILNSGAALQALQGNRRHDQTAFDQQLHVGFDVVKV
jgi:hypothetical protein